MTAIPLYIIAFNHLTYIRQILDYFLKIPSVDPIIIDNASTYPPLLDWYSSCPVPIIYSPQNCGPLALWSVVDLQHLDSEYFAITDPDLDFSQVPNDLINILCEGLRKYPDVLKCGLSLEIGDLPLDSPFHDTILDRENGFWWKRRDSQFFEANIDTTFAVYRTTWSQWAYSPSLRSDRPYTVRHLPWYITHCTITGEDRYYFNSLEPGRSTWSAMLRTFFKEDSESA